MMSTGSNGQSLVASRGDIWLYDPNPTRGREQANVRPGVILSGNEFNQSGRGLVVIVPMTRTRRNLELFPYHIEVEPEATGLQSLSVLMCEQVRSISTDRLLGNAPRGQISATIMHHIEFRIRLLLGL